MSIIEGFIPLTAVVLSLLFPIIAIVYGIKASIRKKQYETELRRLIIENHTDLETAKALIEKQEPKSDKYTSLRFACVLIGVGIGALADYLLHIEGIYFWLVIAFGVGLGLLASFKSPKNHKSHNFKNIYTLSLLSAEGKPFLAERIFCFE